MSNPDKKPAEVKPKVDKAALEAQKAIKQAAIANNTIITKHGKGPNS